MWWWTDHHQSCRGVGPGTKSVLSLWHRYGRTVLLLVLVHAAVTAALRLGFALHLALIKPDEPIDLLYRYWEVRQWFSGVTIYGELDNADYPPASYALLWPLFGWLSIPWARALYVASALAALAIIGGVTVRASGAWRSSEGIFAAIFLLPAAGTQLTLWVGQLGLHVVACLMGASVLLFGIHRHTRVSSSDARIAWSVDIAAAGMLTASLVKPTLSVPVVVAILIVTGRWRPTLLTGVMYLGMILVAAAPQDTSVVALHRMWLDQESGLNIGKGSINVHLWLHWLGVDRPMLPVSLMLLLVSAGWAFRYRHVSPWLVLGVAALVGRTWSHHRAYDDVILVMSALALFEIIARAAESRPSTAVWGGILLGGLYLCGHFPIWAYLSSASPFLWTTAELFRSVCYLAVMGFLVREAHVRRCEQGEGHAAVG